MGLFFDDDKPHVIGKEPNKDPTGWTGPYAFGKLLPYGLSFGAGLLEGHAKKGDKSMSGTGPYVFGGLGAFERDGTPNYGALVEGAWGGKTTFDAGWGAFDLGSGTAQAGAYANKNTASIGAQANAAEGALRLGTSSNYIKGGVSAGAGYAGRVHYGDIDGDGYYESGFGIDVGSGSLDIRTDLPHRLTALITGQKPTPTTRTSGSGEPAAPLNALPAMPDGGIHNNGFKSPLDLLPIPSLPELPSLPSISDLKMPDGGLTGVLPQFDLF
jgi:hypothetical protein